MTHVSSRSEIQTGGKVIVQDMDRKLLAFYLSTEDPEAGPWNRSPRSLYIQYWTRDFIARHLHPFEGIRVCNVGIGAGEWDNYLCDLLTGAGLLTSLDIAPETCRMFAYRQKREGHPNPAAVVCGDILAGSVKPASFDVVTAIGSTATETGDYNGCLNACWRLLRPDGYMMVMDFEQRPFERVERWLESVGGSTVDRQVDAIARGYAFWMRRTALDTE